MDGTRSSTLQKDPKLPIPISLVAGRYLLFDIEAAIFLRRDHNICGYNIGTLAQIPSQNTFLGLPIMLMPEEAQILVDKGIGYVLDDAKAHWHAIYSRNPAKVIRYQSQIHRQSDTVRAARAKDHEDSRKLHLQTKSNGRESVQDDVAVASSSVVNDEDVPSNVGRSMALKQTFTPVSMHAHYITPTTSDPLLSLEAHKISNKNLRLPNLPTNYPLFRHLHSKGYFMTPGLRFGCQYTTYPGDPLRFHSHFLTTDLGWNESINLMDIVGGGRLGTGVKKGFLIGSHENKTDDGETDADDDTKVRTFSIEWAVM